VGEEVKGGHAAVALHMEHLQLHVCYNSTVEGFDCVGPVCAGRGGALWSHGTGGTSRRPRRAGEDRPLSAVCVCVCVTESTSA